MTLRRVGAELGARDGTGPDDDLLLAAHRRESRAAGRGEGRLRERVETLRARGIALSPEFPAASCRAALARDPRRISRRRAWPAARNRTSIGLSELAGVRGSVNRRW